MAKKKTAKVAEGPSVEQLEFFRSVKDLSTSELNYRIAQTTKEFDATANRIGALRTQLDKSRVQLAKTCVERDMLVSIVESRR